MKQITDTQKKWALAATVIGSSMAFINGSVVNVALPAIQSALNSTVADMQWVMSAYAFILGALILIGGSAGDYYGRKRVFGLGVFIFLATTVWCGLAPNVQQLIFARGGQALGGAFMIPGSLAIITDIYGPEQRSKAIGTWSGATALATAAGPILGGLMVDYLSWRFIFFISVPMALATLAILFWKMPESKAADKAGVPDWKGALLATLGLGLICYGLIEGSELGITDPIVLLLTAVGLLVMGIFVWTQKIVENPMVPLSLFSNRSFSGANLVAVCFFFSLGGVFFLLPFNLIQVQGYSATAAGAAFIPFPLLVGGLSRWSGSLMVRHGARPLLILGPVLASLGFVWLGIFGAGNSYWINYLPAISLIGMGMGFSFAPLNTTVMSSVDGSVTGTASGVNKAISRLSGMLSVALLGALAINLFGSELLELMQQSDVSARVQQHMVNEKANLVAAEMPENISASLKETLTEYIHQSFLSSFQTLMYISAGLVVSGALFSATMITYHPEAADGQRV